jgi:hypothetical protein
LRPRAGQLLVVAVGVATGIPVIAAMVDRLSVDWVPIADNAIVAVRSLDALSTHPPLVGQYSTGPSEVVGTDVYNLGPLLFALLALPARLPGTVCLELTMGLVNLACVLGVVALAHRRGGRPLMFAVALALPLMLASLPAESLSDIWNASAPLLPFTVLIFLAWSLGCGEYRLLPLTVVVASFTAQGHLSYAPPSLALFAVGLAGCALARGWIPRRAAPAAPSAESADERPAERPWIVAGAVAGALCWAGPLVEQAIHRPGNLVLLGRAATADEPKLGLDPGWHAVVHAVGVPPWWLREPQAPIERIGDLGATPGAFATATAVLVLAALAGVAFAAGRRRRPDVRVAAALALALIVALAYVVATTPKANLHSAGYATRWGSPAGMWAWLALGWSLATLWRPWRGRAPALAVRPAVAAIIGLGAVVVVALLVALAQNPHEEPYRDMRAIAARIDAALPHGRRTRVDADSSLDGAFLALGLQAGIVYSLRRDGTPVTAPGIAEALGSRYGPDTSADQVLRVSVDSPPAQGGRVLARLLVKEIPDPGDPFAPETAPIRRVVVTLLPPRGLDRPKPESGS